MPEQSAGSTSACRFRCAGPLFRRWLLQLNPDLLKGPFNHAERAEVRLPREWYDPAVWPAGDAQSAEAPGPDTPALPRRGAPHARLQGPHPVLSDTQQQLLLAARLREFLDAEERN